MKRRRTPSMTFLFFRTLCFLSTLSFLGFNSLFGEPSTSPETSTSTQIHVNNHDSKNEEVEVISFTPPQGWRFADTIALPANVKTMVIGKGASEFPPSINLGTEQFSGTLKQYLKKIKEINASQGIEWKDLGMIRTEAGEASLSQIDTKTQWGEVRMMHVILSREGMVYILTAASLKDEFPNFYKDIFNSLRSLRFEKRILP